MYTYLSATSLSAISENLDNKFPKMESVSESSQCDNGKSEKTNTPSSSKNHRKSKSMSQPTTNQRLSMKNTYGVVELRTPAKKEMLRENQKKKSIEIEEKSINMETVGKLFKSSRMRKYGIVMVCQW